MKFNTLKVIAFAIISTNAMANTTEIYTGTGSNQYSNVIEKCTLSFVKDNQGDLVSTEAALYSRDYQSIVVDFSDANSTLSPRLMGEGYVIKGVTDFYGRTQVNKITVSTDSDRPIKFSASRTAFYNFNCENMKRTK